MKHFIIAAGFATALGLMPTISSVQAQSDEVRQICRNKHGLGKYGSAASEAQRKEAAAKIAACIRSGGKS